MGIKLEQFLADTSVIPKLDLGTLTALASSLFDKDLKVQSITLQKLYERIGQIYTEMNLGVDVLEQEKMIIVAEKLGFRLMRLNVGDYACQEVGIERKGSDLFSSVFSERVFQQLHEMQEMFNYSFLVIDRSYDDVLVDALMHGITEKNVICTIVSFMLRGYPPIFMGCKESLALLAQMTCVKAMDGRDRTGYSPIRQKRLPTLSERRVVLIGSLPGVSGVIAQRLLEKFKTPAAIANATEKELQEVEGIGEKKAKEIFNTFHDSLEK